MKRYGWLILIAAAGCTPQYVSGKTQCSDKRECPSGYSCSDSGTSAVRYCVENKTLHSGGVGGKGGSFGSGGALTGRGGSGGRYGSGGATTGRAGTSGAGGVYRTGGTTGRGGSYGTGGSTQGSTLCTGTPISCSSRSTQAECQFGAGCTWNASTEICGGSAYSCSSYASSTTCLLLGCDWSGSMVCKSTPTTSTCSSMTASTACEICMYGSCCGQLLDCVGDSACRDTSTGPLFNAYLDCVVNCCYSSCVP